MIRVRTGRLEEPGACLLMSLDLRGHMWRNPLLKATVRAGSGQRGGQDKPHIPLGTTMASEPLQTGGR